MDAHAEGHASKGIRMDAHAEGFTMGQKIKLTKTEVNENDELWPYKADEHWGNGIFTFVPIWYRPVYVQ